MEKTLEKHRWCHFNHMKTPEESSQQRIFKVYQGFRDKAHIKNWGKQCQQVILN